MAYWVKVCKFGMVVAAVLLLFGATPGWSARIQDGDPGTIGECLSKPDGTTVTLTAEQVLWRGKSGKSFGIKEWFEKRPAQPRLVVVSTTPLPVEGCWTVDVTGTLATLAGVESDGTTAQQRVLIVRPENITVYCDSRGRPFLFFPIKNLGGQWSNMRSLTELSASVASANISAMDSGLPPVPDDPASSPAPPAPGSRDSLKWLPDGAVVQLNGVVVSAAMEGFFYVERADRSFGIRVNSSQNACQGNQMDVSGYMATVGGERVVVAYSGGVTYVDESNTYPRPAPLGMPNRSMGGGPVGAYTPAVGGAAGSNNTGLLVRTWGNVTYADAGIGVFYIDDGTGLVADNGRTGIKVVDHFNDIPATGTYQSATGISASEIPQGSTSSIRVLYKLWDEFPSNQPGTGTVTGTITASGANGKTVKVFCGNSSTTATFSGNTASYSFVVPAGSDTVTAAAIGYKSTTQLASVSGGQTVTMNFTLPAIPTVVDVNPSQGRIAPDGVSETVVTAIVRDIEGRRIGNQAVTWGVDLGSVISSDTTTDAVGEAHLVLHAPTSNGTATVSVTAGGVTSQCFSEFATADAPSVRITRLVNGATVSGDVYFVAMAGDSVGANPGVMNVSVFLDGIKFDSAPDSFCESWLVSGRLPNGAHQITATATDWDGNVSNSNVVTITTQNDIASFSLTPDTVEPNQPVHISGQVTVAPGWSVTVTGPNSDSQLLWSTSGTGSTISVDWPGTSQGGIFTVTATATATGKTTSDAAVNNTTTHPQFLIINTYLPAKSAVISKIVDVAKRRNLTYQILQDNQATWGNIQTALSGTTCRYLFTSTHCQYTAKVGGNITRLLLGDNSQLYAKTFLKQDPADPNHVIPVNEGDDDPNRSGHPVHYVSSISRNWDLSPLKFVWCHGCYSGRNGATPRNLDGSHNEQTGQYAKFSCYQTTGWNDMATALGITAQRAQESGLGYVGWYTGPENGPAINGNDLTGSDHVDGIIIDTFSQLASGTANAFSFEFARNWIWNNRPSYRYDDVVWEDPSNDFTGKAIEIAPYYNWRFYGKSNCVFF